MPKKKSILVYRTGHLGDTVCAIPAFRLIRRFFADAELTLLCDRPQGMKVALSEVIRPLGIFGRIITYTSNQNLLTVLKLVRAVRQVRPDTVIILPQVRESIDNVRRKQRFFRRCGVEDVRGHLFPVLRHAWQPNESKRLVQMLHSISVRGAKPAYDIPIDPASRESVKDRLQTVGVDVKKPFLVFCGGGKDATQRWPLERYGAVLARLTEEVKWPVVGFGSPQEIEKYRERVLPHFPSLRLLDGTYTINEIFELFRLASAYFGNDTGPMHVAASVNCPVFALFSSRALPGSWYPDVEPNQVIQLRPQCESCFLTECVVERHRCLTDITEERVLAELVPFLEKLTTKN